MAWCATCDRFLSPATVMVDGSCPTCGSEVETPERDAATPDTEASEEIPRAPWHFKIAVAAVAVYLGFRAVEGVIWIFDRL